MACRVKGLPNKLILSIVEKLRLELPWAGTTERKIEFGVLLAILIAFKIGRLWL